MEQDLAYEHWADAVEASMIASLEEYHRENLRWITYEEMVGAYLQQVQTTVIDRPGGRTTVHINITPKARAKPPEHYYYRFQKVPHEGWVQMAHRKG